MPYVVLSPGPTENTLGEVQGKPVIRIEGHETYPTAGELNLVTVAYQGGPGGGIDLLTALRGWLDPHHRGGAGGDDLPARTTRARRSRSATPRR